MSTDRFRNVTLRLSSFVARRETLKQLTGLGVAALAAKLSVTDTTGKKRRKKCRKRGQKCGGQKKCCGQQSGRVACRTFPSNECPSLSGRRCAGLEGAACDRVNGNCDCAPGFRCFSADPSTTAGVCQETPI